MSVFHNLLSCTTIITAIQRAAKRCLVCTTTASGSISDPVSVSQWSSCTSLFICCINHGTTFIRGALYLWSFAYRLQLLYQFWLISAYFGITIRWSVFSLLTFFKWLLSALRKFLEFAFRFDRQML